MSSSSRRRRTSAATHASSTREFTPRVTPRSSVRCTATSSPSASSSADDVGEVVLPLVVVTAQTREGAAKRVGGEDVGADVRLGDRALLGRRVAVLHDAGEPAVLVADDPAVVAGIERLRGERRARAAGAVSRDEAGDERAGGERMVAVEHHDVAGETAESREAGSGGIAGAALLVLDRPLHALGEDRGERVVGRRRDDHRALRSDVGDGVEHVGEHGSSAHGVQQLGQVGLHARAEPSREHDHGERPVGRLVRQVGLPVVGCLVSGNGHRHHLLGSVMVGRRGSSALAVAGAGGFEPPDGGTKTRCLTTWLRPTAHGRSSVSPLSRRRLGGNAASAGPHRAAAVTGRRAAAGAGAGRGSAAAAPAGAAARASVSRREPSDAAAPPVPSAAGR